MGMDLYSCSVCGEPFTGYDDYINCKCGKRFCGEDCASDDGYEEGGIDKDGDVLEGTCAECRKEDTTDYNLLQIALKMLDKTRKDLVDIYYDRY